MPVSPRSDAVRMRELILRVLAHDETKMSGAQHQRKLDPRERKLVERLANDPRGTGALARLENWCQRKRRPSCWCDILLACIDAERLARTFPKHIKEALRPLPCRRRTPPATTEITRTGETYSPNATEYHRGDHVLRPRARPAGAS